jgi:hypothetical protein
MTKLKTVLTQERNSGVYRFDSRAAIESLKKEASKQGWRLFDLDGRKIRDKASFLDRTARAMDFPSYFGKNWDALEECLNDLSWAPASGYILLWQSPERLIQGSTADWATALDILETTIKNWVQAGTPFYVLLRGSTPPEIPEL